MKDTQQENLSTTVAELLTAIGHRQLAYVSPKAEVQEIISAFVKAEHARLVYVVDDENRLSGIISLGNLSRHLFFNHCNKAIDNLHLISMATSKTAADFIDRPTIAAHPSESIEPVLERMLSAGIKEIPVLDETGHLVGDLTLVDILQHCAMDIWK